MIEKERLGIFSFYDKDGMVGEYVKVYLESMLPYLEELVIICNGQLSDEGAELLGRYASQVYIREDVGSDGGAYQDAILNILGIDYIRKFQELLLFNDSVYAPIGSWEPVFEKMESMGVDFWGLSQNYTQSVPLHIQSYFIMFCKKILHSEDFEYFWRNLDVETENKDRIIANFEINLTYFLGKRGYSWSTYSSCGDKNVFCNPYTFLSREKLPILKTKVFTAWGDWITTDEEREKARLYIENYSDYDVDMIVKNLQHKEGRDLYQIKCQRREGAIAHEEITSWQDMVCYASQYTKCYLYGNTLKSYILQNILRKDQIEGIVVSDRYEREKEQESRFPVYRFSEVDNHGEGMIVTLSYHSSKMMKEIILKKFPEAIFYWKV